MQKCRTDTLIFPKLTLTPGPYSSQYGTIASRIHRSAGPGAAPRVFYTIEEKPGPGDYVFFEKERRRCHHVAPRPRSVFDDAVRNSTDVGPGQYDNQAGIELKSFGERSETRRLSREEIREKLRLRFANRKPADVFEALARPRIEPCGEPNVLDLDRSYRALKPHVFAVTLPTKRTQRRRNELEEAILAREHERQVEEPVLLSSLKKNGVGKIAIRRPVKLGIRSPGPGAYNVEEKKAGGIGLGIRWATGSTL